MSDTPAALSSPAAGIDTPRVIGCCQGRMPGPLLLVVGGIHGNEYSGILAAQRVLARLGTQPGRMRGRLVALAGNRRALAAGRRYLRKDLNRQWQPHQIPRLDGVPDGADAHMDPEEMEQRELLGALQEELRGFTGDVYFLDLHTSSADGAPFVTVGDTLRNRSFALKLGLPVVLGLEEHIDGALLEYVNNLGHVTAGIEAGRHDAPGSVDNHAAALWLALAAAGMLPMEDLPDANGLRRTLQEATPGIPALMEVRYRHPVLAGDQFAMEPGYSNFDAVPRGAVVATDQTGPLRSVESCRMLLPLYQAQGNDGYFLVREIKRFWLLLSALLRRSGLPSITHWLPGVSRQPGAPETLLVNTHIAGILPLQVLHLLGFRKIRWEGHVLMVTRRRFDLRR